MQLLCLGMLGEYVGRMYTQLQGRPAYFIAYDSLAEHRAGHAPSDEPRTSSVTPGRALTGR